MESKYRFTRSNLNQTVETVYKYIVDFIRSEGYPPSVREICSGVGIKSTSTIHSHLKRLVEMNRIEYTPGKRRAIIVPDLQQENVTHLPVLGSISAGIPILAEQNIERTLPISADFLSSGEYFLLKVKGDSMINAHIVDGDYVIVKRKNSADVGQIVVARIEDEATVKTYGISDGKPFLQPENEAYDIIPFDEGDCQILGVVTGLFRSQL
ncbi:MAG: transcriptional repressor LexA [Clostridiales bacterium]|nr:transcriptional repressor LexA [Clostridiales bacterium]